MIKAPNCSNQRDEDMKLSHTRHETRETPSKQRATRSNKNQSMQEQRTAPPSLNRPLPHSHEPLLDLRYDSWIIFSWSWYWYWYLVLEREVDWDWYNDWRERTRLTL